MGIKGGLAIPLAGSGLLACNSPAERAAVETKAPAPLKILILGGTSFLGPHQIAYAIDRGHSISTFTRGRTVPTIYKEYFEKVEELIGDRENNLEALENRRWDAVIDNSGQRVAWTKSTAELLKDHVGLYLYTSSTGVHYPYLENDLKEEHPPVLAMPEGITDEVIQLEYRYGVMKANSEIEARKAFGDDRTIVVRPTYMSGPADRTNRFIHWPVRLSRGGKTLLPGKATDPVQYIDVRDVAEWMIRLIEEKKTGTFHAVGPEHPQTMHGFADEAATVFSTDTRFVNIDDYEFLKKHGIYELIPWILPEGNNLGSATINNRRGLENGLTLRPVRETVKDTYDWWYSDAITQEQRDKFEKNPEGVLARESAIIDEWEKQQES